MTVNLRKFGWLFGTTLLVGAVGGILGGFLVGWRELVGSTLGNFLMGLLMNVLMGLTISVLAQMGFFSYMLLNYLALSFLKNAIWWKTIQVLLIAYAFFDMVYLRYVTSSRGEAIWPYLIEPVALLVVALVAAYFKVRLTNANAWIPTVFFLFVVTALEWIPALKENNAQSILFMIVPLLFCNIWQVMHLHRLTKQES